MELLTPYLENIKIPTANNKVYKDECVFSFDNPVSIQNQMNSKIFEVMNALPSKFFISGN